MSNKKSKDKKNDPSSIIEKQFQAQKRDLIDADFTIKHLEEKITQKTVEVRKLKEELEEVKRTSEEKIQQLTLRTSDDEKRLTNQINKITDLQIKTTKYESQINSLKDELSMEKNLRFKEVSELRIKMDSQRMKLDLQLKDLQIYMEERESRKVQLEDLREKIQYEKAERVREVADKQREKVQATDKLRDEMLNKIRDMRANLLSLKKEQLSTTTRLTILQNHQLTSQLQYQSKQTEKLIFKDQEMQTKLKKLSQELNIHKEVEDELAKRAHFSKGVIKKLNQKVAELEREIELMKEKSPQSIINQNVLLKSRPLIEDNAKDKETIDSLELQLEQTQKKYSELLSKFQSLEKERNNLNANIKKYENQSNQLSRMLFIHYNEIIGQETIACEGSMMKINVKDLREKGVDNWNQDQLVFTITLLLNLLRPYLTKQNILIPSIKKTLFLEDPLVISSKSESHLPKIMDQNGDIKTGKKKIQDLPINIASKIVASNLREWGSTVRPYQQTQLKRRYKINQSNR